MAQFQINDGASSHIGGDYRPFTVIEVADSGKTVTVQSDMFTVVGDGPPVGTDPECIFEANREGYVEIFTLRKNGRWVLKGAGLNDGYSLVEGRCWRMNPHI